MIKKMKEDVYIPADDVKKPRGVLRFYHDHRMGRDESKRVNLSKLTKINRLNSGFVILY